MESLLPERQPRRALLPGFARLWPGALPLVPHRRSLRIGPGDPAEPAGGGLVAVPASLQRRPRSVGDRRPHGAQAPPGTHLGSARPGLDLGCLPAPRHPVLRLDRTRHGLGRPGAGDCRRRRPAARPSADLLGADQSLVQRRRSAGVVLLLHDALSARRAPSRARRPSLAARLPSVATGPPAAAADDPFPSRGARRSRTARAARPRATRRSPGAARGRPDRPLLRLLAAAGAVALSRRPGGSLAGPRRADLGRPLVVAPAAKDLGLVRRREPLHRLHALLSGLPVRGDRHGAAHGALADVCAGRPGRSRPLRRLRDLRRLLPADGSRTGASRRPRSARCRARLSRPAASQGTDRPRGGAHRLPQRRRRAAGDARPAGSRALPDRLFGLGPHVGCSSS